MSREFYGAWVLEQPQREVLAIWPSGGQIHVAVGGMFFPGVPDGLELELVQGGLRLDFQGRSAVYVRDRVKQVLVYRRDLKMRKGKIAAQCAHASLSIFTRGQPQRGLELRRTLTPEMALWTQWRQAKIVLSVADQADLLRVHELAQQAGLPTALIRDAGLTEFGGVPTLTTVAVGPALERDIDRITKSEDGVPTKLA